MSKPIDWQMLAKRLANPWWGPQPPGGYTMRVDGRKIGVGLLAKDPGDWNCMFLSRGNFSIPDSIAGHQAMIPHILKGSRLAAYLIGGHTLGSYTMLMQPKEFAAWAKGMPGPHQAEVQSGVQALLGQRA